MSAPTNTATTATDDTTPAGCGRAKAKRGDLVVVERLHKTYTRDYGIHEQRAFDLYVVTNVRRDGRIAKVRDARYDDEGPGSHLEGMVDFVRSYLIPSATIIDRAAIVDAFRANLWPSGHEWRPFGTIEAVRAAVGPNVYRPDSQRGEAGR